MADLPVRLVLLVALAGQLGPLVRLALPVRLALLLGSLALRALLDRLVSLVKAGRKALPAWPARPDHVVQQAERRQQARLLVRQARRDLRLACQARRAAQASQVRLEALRARLEP